MATSSITKNFIVSGKAQAEMFADAIEKSYQDSLNYSPNRDLKITHLKGTDNIKNFMAKRENTNA